MDRDRPATKTKRNAVTALRKDSVMTKKAMEILGCTLTELNRWDDQGQMPFLFEKRVSISFGKAVFCRFWVYSLGPDRRPVADQAWREQYRVRKRFRRMGLRARRASP
jgi:hypothetical protein